MLAQGVWSEPNHLNQGGPAVRETPRAVASGFDPDAFTSVPTLATAQLASFPHARNQGREIMTTTATFTLPKSHVPAAQAVLSQWALARIGPYGQDDYTLQEGVEVLETVSALAPLGAPGEPIGGRNRRLDSHGIACLRSVAEWTHDMALDATTWGGTKQQSEYWSDLAPQARSLLEVLP